MVVKTNLVCRRGILFICLLFSITVNMATAKEHFAVYDAHFIDSLYQAGAAANKDSKLDPSNERLKALLRPYIKSSDFGKEIKDNPFLAQYFNGTALADDDLSLDEMENYIPPARIPDLVEVMTRLSITQDKTEVYTSFFQSVRPYLDKAVPELKIIFPKTIGVLSLDIKGDISDILKTLREAMLADLHDVLYNLQLLSTLQNNPDYSDAVNKRITKIKSFMANDECRAIFSIVALCDGIGNNRNIPGLIAMVADTSHLGKCIDPELTGSIRLFNAFSRVIKSRISENSYVTKEQFDSLLICRKEDKDGFRIFCGLLYQDIKNAHVTIKGAKAETYLKNIDAIAAYFDQVLHSADKIKKAYKDLATAKRMKKDMLNPWIHGISTASAELIKNLASLETIDPGMAFGEGFKKVTGVVKYGFEITEDVQLKSYSLIGFHLAKLYDRLATEDQEFRPAVKIVSALIGFAGNMADAKNAADMEGSIATVLINVGIQAKK